MYLDITYVLVHNKIYESKKIKTTYILGTEGVITNLKTSLPITHHTDLPVEYHDYYTIHNTTYTASHQNFLFLTRKKETQRSRAGLDR